jgi:hypothetical protein
MQIGRHCMRRSDTHPGRETAMLESRVEPPSPTGSAPAEAGESSTARQPFVSPTVKDLGGLTRLTQIGGTV